MPRQAVHSPPLRSAPQAPSEISSTTVVAIACSLLSGRARTQHGTRLCYFSCQSRHAPITIGLGFEEPGRHQARQRAEKRHAKDPQHAGYETSFQRDWEEITVTDTGNRPERPPQRVAASRNVRLRVILELQNDAPP